MWNDANCLWKILRWFLKIKLNIELSNDPAIPLLHVYPKESKARAQRDVCMLTALFTIAKRWKQPRYPLTDKWLSEMWSIHTRGYYSA